MSDATATDSRWVVTKVQDVADFFGLKRRAVDQWLAEGCPGSRGSYDLSAITAWRLVRRESASSQRVGGDDLNGHDADLRQRMELAEVLKTEADAATRIVKLRRALGELVEWTAIESRIRDEFNIIRHRLQDLPERIGKVIPLDVRPDVQIEVTSVIYDLLRGMATCQQDCAGSQEQPGESSSKEPTSGASPAKRTASTRSSARSPRAKSRPSSRGRRKT